jgi:tetratricopeptide (TPR) repeat protein
MIRETIRERKDSLSATLFLLLLAGDMNTDLLSAEMHCEMGMAFVEQGLCDRAEQEFGIALDCVEDYPDAFFGLGMVFTIRGSLDEAEEYFLSFMEAEPEDYRGPLELSRLYLTRSDAVEALDMATWAHSLSPDDPDIWMQLAGAAAAAGDTTLSETWLTRTIDDGGILEPEARVMLAGLYRCRELDTEAREILLPATQREYPPALWMLSGIYLGWGDNMRAVDAIRKYLSLAPCGEMADSAAMVLEELAETGDYIPPETH